jgi:hypothetical protein
MDTSDTQGPAIPAGWYADPSGAPRVRWWDGAQWTERYRDVPQQPQFAPPTVAPVNAAPAPAAPRKKRGKIIGLVAGGSALLLVVGTAAAFGIAGLLGAGDPDDTLTTKADWDYAYTAPMLGLERDHVFEFRADYDVVAKSTEVTKEQQVGGALGVFDVFTDAGLSKPAQTAISTDGSTVSIKGDQQTEANTGVSDEFGGIDFTVGDTRRVTNESDGANSWGLHDEYYLVRYFDEKGAALPKPIVTEFTVEAPMPAPVVSYGIEDNNGSLQLSWNEVEGATDYLVVSMARSDAPPTLTVIGEVSTPRWSGASSVRDDANGRPWVSSQNVGLAGYPAGASADAQGSGLAIGDDGTTLEIGVIATDGKGGFSPYIGTDALETAGSLPERLASNYLDSLFSDGRVVIDPKSVPLVVPFTALDGSTRQTVAQIVATEPLDGGYALDIMGQGTLIGYRAAVLARNVPDVDAMVAAFNAAATAAAPPTGLEGFEVVVDTAADQAADPSTTAPETPYPVFGSNDFTRYIAANLIAGETAIDVSGFVDRPGMPEARDAYDEARLQNPYAIGVSASQLSGDVFTVYYSLPRAEIEQRQQQVLARVTEVVASTVTDGMSARDKVTALNDWMTANVEYDYTALAARNANGTIDGFEYAWDASGSLTRGTGVCASYSYGFNALANAAGVETVVVTGPVLVGGLHAWNKVKVDGLWLAVDTTWNDSNPQNQYLMIGDAGFTGPATRSEDSSWMQDLVINRYAAL